MKTDSRVSETEKFGHSGAIRTVGNKEILYAYYTVVAWYDTEQRTLASTEHFWSKTTTTYINKFRRERNPIQELYLGQDELEAQIYTFLAKQAKNRQLEKETEVEETEDDIIDDIFDEDFDSNQKSEVEEIIDRTAAKAGRKPIEIPIGVPIIFVNKK
jgi:hypothetical protein